MRKSALSLGSALLASALVCWVAANWPHATNLQKLAGLQGLLVLLVAGAWLLGWRGTTASNRNFTLSSQLSGLAAVATGALLALVGQIYQTGADTWQLFFWWALLLLPWVLMVQTVFLAVLWGVVANVALLLLLDLRDGFWGAFWTQSAAFALAAALGNLLWLVLLEASAARLQDAWRVGPRVALTGVLAWLLAAQFLAHQDASGGLTVVVPLAGLALLAGLARVYSTWRLDLAMLSLAAVYALGLVTGEVVVRMDSEWGLVPLILLLMIMVGGTLAWFAALKRRSGGTSADAAQAVTAQSWYVAWFRACALWLLAWLLVAFLFLVLNLSQSQAGGVGAAMTLASLLALRQMRAEALREAVAATAAAGFVLLCAAWLDLHGLDDTLRAVVVLALGAVVYALGSHPALRFFTALATTVIVLMLTWTNIWDGLSGWSLDAGGVSAAGVIPLYGRLWVLAGVAIACLWLSHRRGSAVLLPLAWALALAAQVVAWAVPSFWGPVQGGGVAALIAHVLRLGFALLPFLVLLALWRPVPQGLGAAVRWGAPLVLLVSGLGWLGAPGIALGLAWLLLGFWLGRRDWLLFGVLGLLVYLGRFYYDLQLSLLGKAGVLAMAGAWLLVCGLAVRQRVKNTLPAVRLGRLALAGLPVGLALVLVVANLDIQGKETVLREGTPVVLELAPVDPRSIMQGDYMALRYQASDQLSDLLGQRPADTVAPRRGYAVLQPDQDGVYRVVGWQAQATPLAEGQVVMAFRTPRGTPQIGIDSYFFPEGQASRFEQARYGEYRVSPSGQGLLLRLLDAARQPL